MLRGGVMEGRCAVDTLADFGCPAAGRTPKITFDNGTHVLISPCNDEILVFNAVNRSLEVVLKFSAPVTDLVQSADQQLLFVGCESGIYCVSLSALLPRCQSSPADASSSTPELQISSDHLAVAEEGVQSLLLTGSVLVSLSLRGTLWCLTLYKTAASQMPLSVCQSLGQLSLPAVSTGQENGGRGRKPVLTCVHFEDKATEAAAGHVHLESVLFRLLFGVDAALAKSPIILGGLPDGRLFSLPLRPAGSRLKVLHSLEQPVVFVGASVAMETNPGCSRRLVALGESGRLVLIEASGGAGRGLDLTEACVPGLALCGAMDGDILYVGTDSDLLAVDLSARREEEPGPCGEEASSERVRTTVLQNPTSLNVCRVAALTRTTPTATGEARLLALSTAGRLETITLPARTEGAGLPRIPSAPARSMGDLLAAIGDVCERASQLKSSIKTRNQLLQRLNQVVNVSFLLSGGAAEEDHGCPIRCRGVIEWTRLFRRDSLSLTCVLHNASPYVLEEGWTLDVSVSPASCSHAASRHSCFPLQALHPGENLEVPVPLEDRGTADVPLTARCSLVFSLGSFLGEDMAAAGAPFHLSLPLTTLTVDWLDILQLSTPRDAHRTKTSQRQDPLDTTRAFLRSRWRSRPSVTELDPRRFSAVIRVSRASLRAWMERDNPSLGPQGEPSSAPASLCVRLLDQLLSEGPGGGKMAPQGVQTSLGSSCVHARCPDGDAVSLTATEVDEEEESQAAVEVRVESSSLAAVCGVHHAVLRRLLAWLRRLPDPTGRTATAENLGLRQVLRRAEGLLQQIRQSRLTQTLGAISPNQNAVRSLLDAYADLRANPLLLL